MTESNIGIQTPMVSGQFSHLPRAFAVQAGTGEPNTGLPNNVIQMQPRTTQNSCEQKASHAEDLPFDANGKVDRWALAEEIMGGSGEKLRPVEGTDELIFDNISRTEDEIKQLIQELAETVFYYDQFLPEMKDVRWLNQRPDRHRMLLAGVGEKLRKRWNLGKSNPYTRREWHKLVGTLQGLLWTQGYGWNHRNYEDNWLIPMMRECDARLGPRPI